MNETLQQIVAEMRKAAQVERDRSWVGAPHGADEWKLDDWADRIERVLADGRTACVEVRSRSVEIMTVKSTKSGQPTSASLLTREHAEILYATNYDKWPQTRDPLDDLRKGRTACVRVMSEEECLAQHDLNYAGSVRNYEGSRQGYMACARAMGAVR